MPRRRKRQRGGLFGFGQGGTFSDLCRNLKDAEGKACQEKHNLKQVLNCVQGAQKCLKNTLKCLKNAPNIKKSAPALQEQLAKITDRIEPDKKGGLVAALDAAEKELHTQNDSIQKRIDDARAVKKVAADAAKREKKLAQRTKVDEPTKDKPAKKKGWFGWGGGRKTRRRKRRAGGKRTQRRR